MIHRSRRSEREQLVAELRTQGQSWAEIARALQERFGYNARTAMRLAHGWSQARAAEEWSKRWPGEVKTAKNFSHWETWPESGHPPSLSTLVKLSELYGCKPSDLIVDL